MSRKGIIELAAKGMVSGRQVLWEEMRRLRTFSMADLEPLGVERATAKSYMCCLEAGGFLVREGESRRFQRIVYRLVRDVGIEAPRLRADGTPVVQGTSREQMWRAMKMLRQFNYVDLAVSASTDAVKVNETDASDYVRHLARAGYLAILKPSTPTSKTVYRLAKNTGPLSPMVTRAKVVFDPNLGCIAWHEEINA